MADRLKIEGAFFVIFEDGNPSNERIREPRSNVTFKPDSSDNFQFFYNESIFNGTFQSFLLGGSTNTFEGAAIIDDRTGLVFTSVPDLKVFLSDRIGFFFNKETRNVDISGRDSLNTIFGEKITGKRIPNLAAQFHYGIEDGDAEVITVGSGTVGFEHPMLKISTGTDANGYAEIVSAQFIRYIPAHEAYSTFSYVFNTPATESRQKTGPWDGDNGFYIGFEELDFIIGRSRDGNDTEEIIDVSKILLNKSDGSTEPLNPVNGNIYRITWGYLGFAPIHFEVMSPDGSWVFLGVFEYPNSNRVTHITNPNLPIRAIVENFGNTTDISNFSGSLSAGIVDGAGTDVTARNFNKAAPTKTVGSGATASIIAFRNKSTFNSIENRVPAQLKLVSCAVTGNKPWRFLLLKQPPFSSATWADVNASNSTLEFSTDIVVTDFLGETFLNWNLAANDTFFEDVTDQVLLLPPGGVAVFAVSNTGGASGEVELAIRWAELF